jgi:hypothetical protein
LFERPFKRSKGINALNFPSAFSINPGVNLGYGIERFLFQFLEEPWAKQKSEANQSEILLCNH